MHKQNPNRRQFLTRSAALAAVSMTEPFLLPGARKATVDPAREWRQYGGDAGASRYSPLDQINASNVKRLKVAWSHHTEDASERPATTIECEPIVVNGVMYIQTAQLQTRALDAATGKPLWNFNSSAGARRSGGISRGVTHWRNPDDPRDQRIYAPNGAQLHCLNAATGNANPGF